MVEGEVFYAKEHMSFGSKSWQSLPNLLTVDPPAEARRFDPGPSGKEPVFKRVCLVNLQQLTERSSHQAYAGESDAEVSIPMFFCRTRKILLQNKKNLVIAVEHPGGATPDLNLSDP